MLPSSSLPEMRVPPALASSSLPEMRAPLPPGGTKRAYSLTLLLTSLDACLRCVSRPRLRPPHFLRCVPRYPPVARNARIRPPSSSRPGMRAWDACPADACLLLTSRDASPARVFARPVLGGAADPPPHFLRRVCRPHLPPPHFLRCVPRYPPVARNARIRSASSSRCLLTFWNACPAAPRWRDTHVFARPVLGGASVLPSSSRPEMRAPPAPASSSRPEMRAPATPRWRETRVFAHPPPHVSFSLFGMRAPLHSGGTRRTYSLVLCSVQLPCYPPPHFLRCVSRPHLPPPHFLRYVPRCAPVARNARIRSPCAR